ncbi:MAG: hypothetical protein IH629_06885 [Thermoleophilia bacterium]|nr:hypothetical protein [Thermoleophilia bacterium]
MEIDITSQQVTEGVTVRVVVRLSGRETGRLFVSGDTLVQLPLEGSLPDTDGSPLPRAGIFLSELAGKREGLTRTFTDDAAAQAFAAAVSSQLETALEAR